MCQSLCKSIALCAILICSLFHANLFALDAKDSTKLMSVLQKSDSLDKVIKYRTGKVELAQIAEVDIPKGYKFIPEQEAQYILHDLWNNPLDKEVMGMIVKDSFSLMHLGEWVFVVSYQEDGFVKDDDADKINYDDLLKQIQEDEKQNNEERQKEGFDAIHLLGWASTPYYDKDRKVLHWAKKIQFGTDPQNIYLNYDVRILGRKGVLSMNAVGDMSNLADIKAHIPDILKMSSFKTGYKYSEFNPDVDKVAAYTIGGLIAGKLLAKAGFLALLLKNIKLIILAVAGGFAAFKKRLGGLFGKKKDDEANDYTVENNQTQSEDVNQEYSASVEQNSNTATGDNTQTPA